jgi:phage host-nuclease inhibitor protein Gam
MPDMPPTIDAKRMGVGASVSPEALLPMVMSFKDDYGPSRIRKLIIVGKDKPVVDAGLVALPEETISGGKQVKKREFVSTEYVDLQGHNFKPGEVISVVFEAADTLPASFGGPNVTKSAGNEFRIVSAEDMVDDLERRLTEWQLEFAPHQKEQEDATAKTVASAEALEKGPMDGEVRGELEQSAAMQGTVGSECSKAADTINAILDEITNNRVGTPEFHGDVSKGVQDLGDISRQMIRVQAELGDVLKATDNATAATTAKALAKKQDDLRIRLNEIVAKIGDAFTLKRVENTINRIIKASDAQQKAIEFLIKQVPDIFNKPTGGSTTGPSVVQPK